MRTGDGKAVQMAGGFDLAKKVLVSKLFESNFGFVGEIVFDISGEDHRAGIILITSEHQDSRGGGAQAVHSIGASGKRFTSDDKLVRYIDDDSVHVLTLGGNA